MTYNYREVNNVDKVFLGVSEIMPVFDEDNKCLFAFYDRLMRESIYEKLFAAQTKQLGEWNIYSSNEKTVNTNDYLYVSATEFNESIDVRKLHGMKVEFHHVTGEKWLVFHASNFAESGAIQKNMAETPEGLAQLGYTLDYDLLRPIMEYQPQACTKTPEYVELWIPVK